MDRYNQMIICRLFLLGAPWVYLYIYILFRNNRYNRYGFKIYPFKGFGQIDAKFFVLPLSGYRLCVKNPWLLCLLARSMRVHLTFLLDKTVYRMWIVTQMIMSTPQLHGECTENKT